MELSVLTLNIMHGRNRRRPLWPLWVRRQEAGHNLKKIVACILQQNPDIVALQEVDKYSLLSGRFDQFEFLKDKTGYQYGYYASSCSVRGVFQSGQAILSKYPLANCEAHKFPITFPTDRMGFVLADAVLPGKTITVASIHLVYLDWLRRDPHKQELRLVKEALSSRSSPTVLAGDFNCDMTEQASRLGFVPHQGSPTHPSWAPQKRIDWILVKDLQYASYETLSESLSDHLAVAAKLAL
ncbi:MAG TPA: endonuclease/exonuclease/phosphatase family protein [Candidatus Paceibacterota bacterium]